MPAWIRCATNWPSFFGGIEGGEELAHAFAVPIVGDGEADPAARVTAIDWHAGRAEPGHGNRFAVLAPLGGWGMRDQLVRFRVSCRHFVAILSPCASMTLEIVSTLAGFASVTH